MSSVNVISINPAKSAKSALHPEVFERIAREYSISRDTTKMNISAKRTINFIFGINKKIGRKSSAYLLAFRALAACAFIGGAFMVSSLPAISSIAMVLLGVTLLLGLFSRATSLAGALYFGYMAFATPELIFIVPAVISAAFCFSGPGIFSIDQLLRRASFRYAKRRAHAKAVKLAENRLSYRAMRYQTF